MAPSEKLQDWMTPVVVHTHTRLGKLLENSTLEENERIYHESETDFLTLLPFLQEFASNPEIVVCDTDHPIHFLLGQGVDPARDINFTNLYKITGQISAGAIERSQILNAGEHQNRVITGIEADILDPTGRLDVRDEVLKELGIVIASFHYNNWLWINNTGPSKIEYFSALINAVSNQHVDILGHPCRDLRLRRFYNDLTYQDWHDLLDIMSEKQVAYEINLNGKHVESEEYRYEREVLRLALEKNVPLILGVDFHNFRDYFENYPVEIYTSGNKMPEIIRPGIQDSNLVFFLRLKRLTQDLASLGIHPENILNTSYEVFTSWAENRNIK